MRYRFITILHFMQLENIKNKGVQIFRRARISNGLQERKLTLNNRLLSGNAGIHSADEFEGTTYLYIDGELEDVQSEDEMNEKGLPLTFMFLRQAQQFVHQLWLEKDNSVYVRDGFLIAYDKNFEDGLTYKASVSSVNTNSDAQINTATFTDEEIYSATKNLEVLSLDDFEPDQVGGKQPKSDMFFKDKSDRISRAHYFSLSARATPILPTKIVSYCNALECLFTTGTAEISHKIAERVALMIGTSKEEKTNYYRTIKKAYGIRSTITHGQHLKGSEEKLATVSRELDSILRELLKDEHEVFSKNDSEIEEFFLDLLFG